MDTKKLLKERGKQYGSFELQVKEISRIMNSLKDMRHQSDICPTFIEDEDVENFFLVLKLVRMQTALEDPDSIDDLIGYATLVREKRFGERN